MATKRKTLGNGLRFKIFHRDAFTCQYCGKRPPEIILEADHVIPVAHGGKDDVDNLVTSCRECNSGKRDKDLSAVPKRVTQNAVDLKERYEQMVAFYKFQNSLDKMTDERVGELSDYWAELWDEKSFLTVKSEASIRMFLNYFTTSEIKEAMFKSTKLRSDYGAFKYMCGILHNKRKER